MTEQSYSQQILSFRSGGEVSANYSLIADYFIR